MAAEHPVDRYAKALKAEEAAAEVLEMMASRFQGMAETMRHWRNLGFRGRLDENSILQSTAQPIATIDLNSPPPTLRQVYDAHSKYVEAASATRGAYEAMSSEQREMIAPGYRR